LAEGETCDRGRRTERRRRGETDWPRRADRSPIAHTPNIDGKEQGDQTGRRLTLGVFLKIAKVVALRVARFLLLQQTCQISLATTNQNEKKIPNDQEIYQNVLNIRQMAVKYTKWT
jgi:hypothetical protein